MKAKILFISLLTIYAAFAQTTLSGFVPSSDYSSSSFGAKTALHDNTFVVSSQTFFFTIPGKVYVFSKVNQVISQDAVLYPTDAVTADQYGQSISVFGDYIAVSSPLHDEGFTNAGAVYIYKKINNVWTFVQKITAFDAAANDNFGSFVKIQGTSLFISAPNDQNTTNTGSVYVYSNNGTNWVFQQKLNGVGFNLGIKLEVQSNLLVVSDGVDNFHTFTYGSSWTFSDSILNIGSLEYDVKDFSFDGNRLYITAVSPLNPTDNAVLIRNRVNNAWVVEPGIDVNFNDFIVGKIAVSGNHMLVGYENYILQNERKFPVRYFKKVSNSWVFQTNLFGDGPITIDDKLGNAISMQDAEVLIGAPENGVLPTTGKAYNYNLNLLSVESLSENSFSIYPNPTTNSITVKNSLFKPIARLDLYSMTGKMLLSTSTETSTLSLENFQSGIYLLKITAENGTFETHKIIKN
jgi:hypothetical protein